MWVLAVSGAGTSITLLCSLNCHKIIVDFCHFINRACRFCSEQVEQFENQDVVKAGSVLTSKFHLLFCNAIETVVSQSRFEGIVDFLLAVPTR